MKVEFLLDGISVNPLGVDNMSLEANYDQQAVIAQGRPQVGVNNLRFAREDVAVLMQRLTSNPGITEGVPFEVRITEGGVTESIKLYVDLTDGLQRSNDGIEATIKMFQSLDWLDDRIDGFTFESLYNETGVAPFTIDGVTYTSYQQFMDSRVIYVPYVISTIPNWQSAFMSVFSIVFVSIQLYTVVKNIIQWLTPAAGAGVTIGVAQAVSEILYAAILFVTLVNLINQLIDSLIQPLKYHGAMLMSDLLKVVAAKLGLSFQSSIYDQYPFNRLAFIPEKFGSIKSPNSSFNLFNVAVNGINRSGFTEPVPAPSGSHTSETEGFQKGYFNGTGGDFLRLAKQLVNGKYLIPNGSDTLVVERRDYRLSGTPYQLPPVRADWNGYNTDELTANTVIRFAADLNERNSIDYKTAAGESFYVGTILQATHQQLSTVNKNLVMLKGTREIQIPVSRGAMKDQLTFIERMIKDMKIVWDAIRLAGIYAEAVVNTAIDYFNVTGRLVLNAAIAVFNTMISVLRSITGVLNSIIDAVNTLPNVNIAQIGLFDGVGSVPSIPVIPNINFITIDDYDDSPRLNALLCENDLLTAPKLVMVDTSRTEYVNRRIAYLDSNNQDIVNARYLWDNFYSIDAFIGANHNRFTRISPALNTAEEKNRVVMGLQDFKRIAADPNIRDMYGEDVIVDSVQWFPLQGGAAVFDYRKRGWLKNPDSMDAVERSEEITINLDLKITLPNGQ